MSAKKIKSSKQEEVKDNANAKLNEKELAFFSAFVGAENLMDISLSRSSEEEMTPVEVIDTGSYLLNDALGCDGLPCGRLIQYYGAPGCHRKGQGILMYDGSIKKVENIIVGDQLMGMDSSPRTVLHLCNGEDDMVEIVPKRGNSWVVNMGHILTLSNSNELMDISVSDYIDLQKSKQVKLKLIRTGVDFVSNETLEIDPYFLGILLGDGSIFGTITIGTKDAEIVESIKYFADQMSLTVTNVTENHPEECPKYMIGNKRNFKDSNGSRKNILIEHLRDLKLYGTISDNKFIPQKYKVASKNDRLKMLAGLLDTDGYLGASNCFDFISKSKQLADDVSFIARSVGLYANNKKCVKTIKSIGFSGEYHRVIISGDTSIIPTKIPRKIAKPRGDKQDLLKTKFTINKLGKEEYFGFAVDGDNRYLLDDFTITHNSSKTLMSMLAIKNAQAKDPTAKQLFIDAEQTFDKKWAKKLGVDPTKIIVVDGETAVYGRKCFELLLGVPKEDAKTHAFAGKTKPGLLDRIANKEFNINLIVLDSLGTLIPPGEDVAIVGKQNMALMARFLSTTMKKLTIEVSKANIPMIVINHIKATMDMYGPDHTSSGGNSYFHTLSANVYFEPVNRKDAQILDEEENKIGGTIRFTIEKSKFGPSPRRGEFRMHFTKGIIDKHLELIKLGIKYGVIKRASSVSYEYEGEKFVGVPKLEAFFVDKEDLCKSLLEKIKEAKASGVEETPLVLSEEDSDSSFEELFNKKDESEE